ncbi:MAG: hypothetical protein AABX13_06635 [Nanoarchaeota archaeon]
MKKRRNNFYLILAGILLLVIVAFIFLKLLQKPPILTTGPGVEQLFSPELRITYPPSASLQNLSFYQAGFTPVDSLGKYLLAFTNDKNYTDTYQHLIEFQQGLNGIGLNSALNIDKAMAESLSTAAQEVKRAGDDDQEACSYFNALLNPSLLVMDLTLWTGYSEIYSTLQQYRDVGIQCEFYYPQLSHGLFTYDLHTGRIVQRSVFCDPSEGKSKCFGVWDYFWKYALEPVNYGVGCTLTEWTDQGFLCVNGIDLQTDAEGKIMKSFLERSVEGQLLDSVTVDVKEEFQNALGASGKSIIDKVREKCARVKEKTNKYTTLFPALTGSSLTGGAVSTEISSSGAEELQKEYEKAMLFASLFSEACVANPTELAADLANGGGAGRFGLNDPKSCIMDGARELPGSELQPEVRCLEKFLGPGGMEKLQGIDGIPDNQCLPSASQSGSKCTDISCLLPGGKKDCGSDGTKCGRKPTRQEDQYLKNAGAGKAGEKWQVVDTRKEMDEICGREGGSTAAACASQKTKTAYILKENIQKNSNNPTTAEKPDDNARRYTFKALVKHEQNHITKDNPAKTNGQNEEDRKNEDLSQPNNFVKPKQKEPAPEGLEPDECSAQAQKIDALADCLDKAQLEKFVHKPTGLAPGARGPTPDPNPEEREATIPSCDEAAQPNSGGGYFGTQVGAADQCLIGDFCDFNAFGGSFRTGVPKKCWFVENSGGKNKCDNSP